MTVTRTFIKSVFVSYFSALALSPFKDKLSTTFPQFLWKTL